MGAEEIGEIINGGSGRIGGRGEDWRRRGVGGGERGIRGERGVR